MKAILKQRRNFALLCLASLTALLALPIMAYADVTSVTGGGFAASATVLGTNVIPPTPSNSPVVPGQPGVNLTVSEPTDSGQVNEALVNIPVPNVVTLGIASVNVVAAGVATAEHDGAVTTTSSVASAIVGPTIAPALTVGAIQSTCTSNGTGSTGATSIASITVPVVDQPAVNAAIAQVNAGATNVVVPLSIGTITLNQQTVTGAPGSFTAIKVQAVRVQVPLLGFDVILGVARCRAEGPDVGIVPGSLTVTKDAPADAQNVTFTFTISCPPDERSPFTRTVTGDGVSAPITGLTPGTVCTATEQPTSGFVNQPNQTFPAVVGGQRQTVTFVNTRDPGQTGSVTVAKQAPADAQNIAFNFTITCPGAVGSPFARTVTGTGTSTAVTGIPAGTVCTAAEAPTAGFINQPNQNLPAVTANQTQSVTFFNQRTGTTTGGVAIIKQAPADAQDVTFNFSITCPNAAGSPFPRSIVGSGTTTAINGLPVGTVCTAAETTAAGFAAQPNQNLPAVTAGNTQTVTFVNTRVAAGAAPTIQVQKSASPISLPEPGGNVTFTVRVTNTGNQSVILTSLQDDIYGNLAGRGSCATGVTIAASPGPNNTYTCSFTLQLFGIAGATETNRVIAVVTDPAGRTGTATSNAVTVSITAAGTQPVFPPSNIFAPTIVLPQQAPAERGAIIVNNNNSSSSSSSAAASAGGAVATPVQAPKTVTGVQTLARTGIDSLVLAALAFALIVAGSLMVAARPAIQGRAPNLN